MPDNILIFHIEDDNGDALIISEALNSNPLRKFTLERVDGLLSALNSTCIERADVILLDHHLPDTPNLFHSVTALKQRSAAPILVMSGMDSEGAAQLAIRAGTYDFVSKNDFTSQGLWNAVLNSIERDRIEAELRSQLEALGESASAFTAFLETSPDGIVIFSASGEPVWSNIVGDVMLKQPGFLAAARGCADRPARSGVQDFAAGAGARQQNYSVSITRVKASGEPLDICVFRNGGRVGAIHQTLKAGAA